MPASEPSSDLDQTIGRAFLREPGDGAPAVLPGARSPAGPFDRRADLSAIRSNALERLHPQETQEPGRRTARIGLAGAGLLHAVALTALLSLEQPPPPAEGGSETPIEIIVEARQTEAPPSAAIASQPVSEEPATPPPDAQPPAPAPSVTAETAPPPATSMHAEAPSAPMRPAAAEPVSVTSATPPPESPPPPPAPIVAAAAEPPPAATPSVPEAAQTEIAAPLPAPMASAAEEPILVAPSPPPAQTMPVPQTPAQAMPSRVARPKPSPPPLSAERDLKAAREKQLNAEREAAKARAEARRQAAARSAERHGPAEPAESGASAEAIASYGRAILGRISALKAYPESARQRNAQGTVVIRFVIGGGGAVTSASIAQSSGDSGLDADALATVRRASPFGAPPPGAPRTIAAPLHYHIP